MRPKRRVTQIVGEPSRLRTSFKENRIEERVWAPATAFAAQQIMRQRQKCEIFRLEIMIFKIVFIVGTMHKQPAAREQPIVAQELVDFPYCRKFHVPTHLVRRDHRAELRQPPRHSLQNALPQRGFQNVRKSQLFFLYYTLAWGDRAMPCLRQILGAIFCRFGYICLNI